MIEIKNLNKTFGEKVIFQNFQYQIPKGSMVAIVGASGSGKSTLLNMIGLLDFEYDGSILFDGLEISKMSDKKKTEYIRNHINYLFQNYALIDEETVEENLLLALTYEKMSQKEKLLKINETLILVGLENYHEKKVYTLSGGEQQRVALARIILKRGDIILADEPTGNLDDSNSEIVIDILKELQKEGKTIVIVTHNQKIADKCDTVLKLT